MSLLNAVAEILERAQARSNRAETPIEAMLRETCLEGNRPPDAALKDSCDRLIAGIDYLDKIRPHRDTTEADIQDAWRFVGECRAAVKARLPRSRRFEYRARRFYLDKTGTIHVCRLQPGELSPLGRRYGCPLSAR